MHHDCYCQEYLFLLYFMLVFIIIITISFIMNPYQPNTTEVTFTGSKSTIETLERGYVQS